MKISFDNGETFKNFGQLNYKDFRDIYKNWDLITESMSDAEKKFAFRKDERGMLRFLKAYSKISKTNLVIR